MKLSVGQSIAVGVGGAVLAQYAPTLGKHAGAARALGIGVGIFGAFCLLRALSDSGGLLSLVGGGLAPDKPVVEPGPLEPISPDQPIVNPGAGQGSQFIQLDGDILSPAQDSTLHARAQLLTTGTYPIELEVRNNRDSDARGSVRIKTIEDTLFGAVLEGGATSQPLHLPAHTSQRLVLNVPCASGRFSAAVKISAFLSWRDSSDNRVRDMGRVDFLLT